MKPFREHHLLQLLDEYETSGLPLDRLMHDYFKKHRALGSKDRAFVAETAYDMVRWRGLLDHLGKPTWEERYKTYRENPKGDSSMAPHIRLSFPKELYDMVVDSFGKEAEAILAASNTEAPVTLRVNTMKTTVEKLLEKFPGAKAHNLAITLPKRLPLFSLPEFQAGHFEMQDEASQMVAALVEAKPGQQVLDYCAGSGGKTLAFAPAMQGKGQIYLHDVRGSILMEAKRRLKRAGIENAQIKKTEDLHRLKKKCDWVLVDAPCSGTGTLRRNPDMKWRFKKEMVERLVGEQRTIFEKALSYVKPGGKIVYATCSLLKEENQNQLDHFIKTYGLKLDRPVLQTLPEIGGMDGFFAAVLIKP